MNRDSAALSLALLLLVPAAASALDLHPRDVHLRAGVSLNPDQLHAGVQAAIGSPARVVFRPSLDLGVGNGVFLASLKNPNLSAGEFQEFAAKAAELLKDVPALDTPEEIVWEAEAGRRVATLRGHKGDINDVAIRPGTLEVLTAGTGRLGVVCRRRGPARRQPRHVARRSGPRPPPR
jgi:hypothetical protein